MNTSHANQRGKTGIDARTRMPAMKKRTVTAGSQPVAADAGGFREATAKAFRQNIAGAPYYRGLRWDY